MKLNSILIIVLVAILLCFFCVIILTRPAISEFYDLSSSGNVGDTIGGITSPIIGLISIILLYITLNRQIESIKDQKIKNESDIIFLLINQFEVEYNSFFLYKTVLGVREKMTGFEGLTYLCDCIGSMASSSDNKKIGQYYYTNQIICIIRSYKLIEERIELAAISAELKQVFLKKLQINYDSKLKDQLTNFIRIVNSTNFLKDEMSTEIEDFIMSHN